MDFSKKCVKIVVFCPSGISIVNTIVSLFVRSVFWQNLSERTSDVNKIIAKNLNFSNLCIVTNSKFMLKLGPRYFKFIYNM